MAKSPKTEGRWVIVKDYYRGDENFTDTWVVVYGSKEEAEACKARLEAGQDKSWYDTDSDEQAFLYVDYMDGFSTEPL